MSTSTAMSYISVSRAQCALNAHGAHLSVDGQWGPNTDAALTRFIGHNFDYGYTPPPDGAAVVMVTSALNRALLCPAPTTSTPLAVPAPSPFPWGWLALGGAVAVGGFLWWRYA